MGTPIGTVAILAALPQELAAIHDSFQLDAAADLRPLEGHRFVHRGLEVVAVRVGVGKVNAAMATQRVIDAVAPAVLINIGVAGGLDTDRLSIGDVVVARDCGQHDLDARPLGFALGEVPYTGIRYVAADPALVSVASGTRLASHRVHVGRVLSGDQFIRRATPERAAEMRAMAGLAVEMEGAAVSYVAASHGIPFAVVRTISDYADGSASVDFERFLASAGGNSLAVCRAILDHLAGTVGAA